MRRNSNIMNGGAAAVRHASHQLLHFNSRQFSNSSKLSSCWTSLNRRGWCSTMTNNNKSFLLSRNIKHNSFHHFNASSGFVGPAIPSSSKSSISSSRLLASSSSSPYSSIRLNSTNINSNNNSCSGAEEAGETGGSSDNDMSSSGGSACPFSGLPSSSSTTGGGKCPMEGVEPQSRCPMTASDCKTSGDSELPESLRPVCPISAVKQLGKHRLSYFVSFTATAAYIMCGGADIFVAGGVTFGTYLLSISANTANQSIEVHHDKKMKRTAQRLLVTGRVARSTAVALSAAEFTAGCAFLSTPLGGGPAVAAIGALNWLLYVGLYTPLKRVSTTNTWWGAVVGALPPWMGAVAAVGVEGAKVPEVTAALASYSSVGVWDAVANATLIAATSPMGPGHVLAVVMFLWQIPHFMALAFHCRRDYEGAGFKMIAFHHPTRATLYAISTAVVMSVFVTGGLPMCGVVAEKWYLAVSMLLNAALVYRCVEFHNHPVKNCRTCFVFSYIYLSIILACMILNHFGPERAAERLYNSYVNSQTHTADADVVVANKGERDSVAV